MRLLYGVFAVLILVSGCDNIQSQNDVKPTQKEAVQNSVQASSSKLETNTFSNPGFKIFYVYADKGSRENHFTPSGFMPNGKCLKFNDRWQEDCHSGTSCIKIEYDVKCSRKDQRWAGIYWLQPPNNWGKRKGGYDLSGAKQLTFWARGQDGGEQLQEVTVGGITGNYPDTDIAVIGPIIMGTKWKKYTIDLRGKDLSYLSGGFSWSTSEEVNPESCTFYLDEIRFE